jgi:hypothetical protein
MDREIETTSVERPSARRPVFVVGPPCRRLLNGFPFRTIDRTLQDRAMTTTNSQIRAQFDELKEGDRVEVEHLVTVGQKSWTSKTAGTVVRTERRRHGMHFQRNHDDKVFGDEILLELPDGELTTVALDEYTTIRRA